MQLFIKVGFAVFLFSVVDKKLKAQEFKISCDTVNYFSANVPNINFSRHLFDDGCSDKRITLQKKGNKFFETLKINYPMFISLQSSQLLAIPNKNVNGVLSRFGDVFIVDDTNNINRLFISINDTITSIVVQYSKKTEFDKFLKIFDSLKNYINNAISHVASPYVKSRYTIGIDVIAALNQYYNARLAHFAVLPVLLQGNYTDSLNRLIEINFKKIDPSYWLQIQPGTIFLRTYFTKIVLPKNDYSLQKSLAYSYLFGNKRVRNYLTYHYFTSFLSNDSASNILELIKKEFTQYETENKFTEDEQGILKRLKSELIQSGSNIIPLFSKQVLTNEKGRHLTIIEKNEILLNKGNVILDYWASWCAPCISFIKTLKSDEIVYDGEKYKIIFISIDKRQEDWLSKKYPAIRTYNSYRLADLNKFSFYKAFEIIAIPRLFLIKNGVLINQNFEKEKL